MIELIFPVCVDGGDADVEISVSEKDAKMLQKFSEYDEFDCPEDAYELKNICQKLRKRIYKALCEQVEEYEDIDLDDLDFTFGFPDFE